MSTAKDLCRPLLLIVAVALVVPAWAGDAPAADSSRADAEVRVRSQVPPYYPATASLTRADAVVVLAAQIGADGKVADLDIVDCSRPNLGFEDAAADAVRHWRFKPATKDGEAVPTETFVTMYIGPPSHGKFSGSAFTQSSFGTTRPPAQVTSPPGSGGGSRTTTAGGLDKGIIVPERPNCTPGVRCMYDRSQINRHSRLVPLPRPVTNKSRVSAAAGGR